MTNDSRKKIAHLRWIIERRNENQMCAVELFELFEKYPQELKKKDCSLAAQALVGIVFSLWRAAFLADKTGDKGVARKAAHSFLEKVIHDNAIAYAQDRAEKEWTFNYYVNNARLSLIDLADNKLKITPSWEEASRSPKMRWKYSQKLLSISVNNFKLVLEKRRS